MSTLKILSLIFIVSVPAVALAQDTIFLTLQRQLYAKVVEVEEAKVKYRKFENPEGPVYSINKTDVLAIHYSNGTLDVFNQAAPGTREKPLTMDAFNTLVKTPHLKVYVTAADSASVIHATNSLQNATTWILTGDKSTAQIVVRFVFVSIGMGDKKGKAQFVDPVTDELIYETGYVNTTFSWDMNTKRGVISKIVNNKIKKLIKNGVE